MLCRSRAGWLLPAEAVWKRLSNRTNARPHRGVACLFEFSANPVVGGVETGANSANGPLRAVFSPIFCAQMGAYAPTRRMAFIVFENPRIRRTRFRL